MQPNYPLYCDNCFLIKDLKIPLQLTIIEKTTWNAKFAKCDQDERNEYSNEIYPTFDVETGSGEVEWEPEFICPNCKNKAWILNSHLVYNEEDDKLYIPLYDPDDILGWNKPSKEHGPKELPKICHLRDIKNVA